MNHYDVKFILKMNILFKKENHYLDCNSFFKNNSILHSIFKKLFLIWKY